MGTLGLQGTRRAAFETKTRQRGINFGMSNFSGSVDVGVDAVDPAATIRAGQLVANSAAGIVPANVNNVIGVSKFDHTQYGRAVIINEAVVLNGTTASNLSRANVSNVAVRSTENIDSAPFTVTTDYTLNATNGTIARNGAAIADGATVFVTYTYDLVASDFDFDGLPFHYQFGNNYSATQERRIVVIKGPHELFTTEWDTSRRYGLIGPNSNLFCDANGRFSSNNAGSTADFVGKVLQLPISGDAYLGIQVAGTVRQAP